MPSPLEAGPEMNAFVAQKLGWTVRPYVGPLTDIRRYELIDPCGNGIYYYASNIVFDSVEEAWQAAPLFSADIAAAMQALDKLTDDHKAQINMRNSTPDAWWYVSIYSAFEGKPRYGFGSAADLPLAICRAIGGYFQGVA